MTSVLIIFEMTGGYGLVLPLMIANMSAFALLATGAHLPVYEALLAQDGIHLSEARYDEHRWKAVHFRSDFSGAGRMKLKCSQ